MTAKVLQLVNSAFFGVQRHISDPFQATMLLGLKTVSVLVLSIRIFSQLDERPHETASVNGMVPHCVQTAARARAIATSLTSDPEVIDHCGAAGLLHDVGKLILATKLPDQFREVVRRRSEEQISFGGGGAGDLRVDPCRGRWLSPRAVGPLRSGGPRRWRFTHAPGEAGAEPGAAL